MCNIVTEFYLYSIVYTYLINSRLDVTYSVRHHFRTIQIYQDLFCKSFLVVFLRTGIPIFTVSYFQNNIHDAN